MATRQLPTWTVYVVPPRQREPISQQQRLDLLHRLAVDDTIRLPARAIASLVLLYAQPLSRIRTLTTDDITTDDGNAYIALGEPPSPVPPPFADLLHELTRHREDTKNATDLDHPWLLPGRNAGQPLSYGTLRRMLANAGVQPRSTRIRALRQLVLQVPAPVVATALGFHQTTAHRQHVNAGGVWNRYATSH